MDEIQATPQSDPVPQLSVISISQEIYNNTLLKKTRILTQGMTSLQSTLFFCNVF